MIDFLWKYIIYRFDLPKSLTMDNGIQFNNLKIECLCEMYEIKVNYSPAYYPQANGMVEVTNKAIVGNMRRNLEDKKGAGWKKHQKFYGLREKRRKERRMNFFCFGIQDESNSSYQNWVTNFNHHGCEEHRIKPTPAN